jgi:zinc protease
MPRCAALILLIGSLSYAAVEDLAIEHYTLPNGMGVIFHVDDKTPIVHLNLRFQAGSKDDPPGRTGLAHLFEHLLFHGVGAVNDYTITAAHAGAIEASASMDFNFTEYYDTVLEQEQLDSQRAVVINEKRQKGEHEPYWRVDLLIQENLFPPGQLWFP